MAAPLLYRERDYFFMVAGYNAGKSFTIVLLMIVLALMFNGAPITVGIGGGTMKLLNRTTLASFRRLAAMLGLGYDFNRNDSIITIGTTEFIIIATDDPSRIYAYNFNIFICDELDELPQEKALEVFKAVQERTRVPLPATAYFDKGSGDWVEIPARSAYSMFLTTAQGYRGTYQIIEEIKERGDGYFLIHARSADNLSADPRWLERMKSIYTEVEQLVFLDGGFANLTTGRVYYEYDEAIHRLPVAPFELTPNDEVWVGQDLNVGYSHGTAYVKRMWSPPNDGQPKPTMFIVRGFVFKEIGQAPRMLRTAFPEQSIYWYPDASGNEILAGYRKEMLEYGIRLRTSTVNPHILDRAFIMNKMFRLRRMYLFPGASTAPLSMALKVRQYGDDGMPEKGKGPLAPDHPCDSAEYALWRRVQADKDFYDIFDAARKFRVGEKAAEVPQNVLAG